MNGAFASRSLAEQESILNENVDLLLDPPCLDRRPCRDPPGDHLRLPGYRRDPVRIYRLEKQSQKGLEIDLRLWYNYTTFDLIGDLAFGESFNCLASSTCHEWVQFVLDYFYVASLLQVVHRFRPLNKLLAILLPPSLIKKKETHSRIALEKFRRRVQRNTEKPDFISHMLKAINTGLITVE
jgi:hypothetical protein